MIISDSVINTLITWIDTNLHESIRIEQLAKYTGYSKWYLQRLFAKYTGESLGRYIRQRKLHFASRDLCETEESIMHISLRYGFDSQQTFTRVFTRHFKLSPGVYRKINKRKPDN